MNSRGVGSASETSGCVQHISICLGRKQGFRLASHTSKVIKAYKQRIRQLKFQSASEWTARSRWRTLCASLMRNPQTSGVSWHLHLPIRFTNIHPCAASKRIPGSNALYADISLISKLTGYLSLQRQNRACRAAPAVASLFATLLLNHV